MNAGEVRSAGNSGPPVRKLSSSASTVARESGAARFATTVQSMEQDDRGVDVRFSDGSFGRYDLVVGADGVRSSTGQLLGLTSDTEPVGLGVWRILASRPAEVTRAELYYGGRCPSAGYTPTSERSLYAFLYERVQDRRALSPAEQLAAVLESHLLDAPWNRGRVVLIGDAAHAVPPTLAQGAAMALEDAAVLAELLLDRDELDDALWSAFGERRQERVRAIVNWSLQLCRWQMDGERGDVAGVTARVTELVSRPA